MILAPKRNATKTLLRGSTAAVALACALAHPVLAETRPTGGQVVAGDAAIGMVQGGMLIDQTSDRAVINWNSFDVGAGVFVDFQNGDGATLNRITGDSVTNIDGLLSATGSVYVMNDNGVVIGQDGLVDVGGSFVATTLGMTNSDFLNGGDDSFAGTSTATVINFGRIGALGGDVALIGARVENHGTITAPDGTAALVAGYDVLMRDASLADGQFVVRLGGPDTSVLNTGRITAAAAELRANQGNVLALAGNTDGLIRADGISRQGGRIFLTSEGGTIEAAGTLDASNENGAGGEVILNAADITLGGLVDVRGLAGDGGTIKVEGAMITLSPDAALDASGTTGGLIRIGGDLQGGLQPGFGDAMANATDVTVAAGAQITADGLAGQGGNIVLWADRNMSFHGAISATGTEDGAGGFAEVSGGFLLYEGSADLTSASGVFGDLLLDPYNITISTGANSGNNGFTANANNSVINVTTLNNALATANVTVFTGNSGAQAGNINVNAPIRWDSNARLTLRAANDININQSIIGQNGGLILNTGGDITATAAIEVWLFDLQSGAWSQFGNLPDFYAADFRITGGTFERLTGIVGEAYGIGDIYGLQGLASYAPNPGYALANSIDATTTVNWNDGLGFQPIGTPNDPFYSDIYGEGHAIFGLTINRPGEDNVGLIGYSDGSYIQGIGLYDVDITGRANVGAIVGYGDYFVDCGECIDYVSINSSWATGTVTAQGNNAGGLVGLGVETSISQSWARVDVQGRSFVGGLVGTFDNEFYFGNTIYESYAVGSVTATNGAAGGLVGRLQGIGASNETINVDSSYATGAVSGSVAGGLVGQIDNGVLYGSYWDTETTGQSASVGEILGGDIYLDATGLTSAQARDPAFYPAFFSSNWFFGDDLRPLLNSTFSEEIWVPEQLQLLAAEAVSEGEPNGYLDENVTLMTYMDLGAVLADPAGIWGDAGWLPIGEENAPFTGSLTGDAHLLLPTGALQKGNTIDGLVINRDTASYVGLFGYTQGASFSNIALTNVDVTGFYVVGGLVGQALSSDITDVFVDGTVEATNIYAGGLAGFIGSLSSVVRAGSDVAVSSRYYVGGLVGYMQLSSISDSYATGDVTALGWAGGLAGGMGGSAAIPDVITNSYSTGRVTATTYPDWNVGGLVGVAMEGSSVINGSFWDIQSSGQTDGIGFDSEMGETISPIVAAGNGPLGLTTAQFQNTDTFFTLAESLGWNFETWSPTAPSIYPLLYSINPVVWLDANGTTRVYGQDNGVVSLTITQTGGTDPFNNNSYLFGPVFDLIRPGQSFMLTGITSASNVGTYAYHSGPTTSANGVNYNVVSSGPGMAITPASLTVTPDDDFFKIYGAADPTFTYTATGFVLGQNASIMTGALGRSQGENASSTPYLLNLGTVSAGPNYTITFAGDFGLFIDPATLVVTPDGDVFKVYGDEDPEFLYSVSGLQFDDTASIFTGELGREQGENVSNSAYLFTLGSLSAGSNYTLELSGDFGLFIDPATLIVTPDGDVFKVYGEEDPEFLYTVSGLQFDDTASIISGELGRARGENVRDSAYRFSLGTLSAGSNYILELSGDFGLFITPATLFITPDGNVFKVYGDEDPEFLYAVTGFQFNDTASLLTGELGRAAGENASSSAYLFDLGSLAANSNYVLQIQGGYGLFIDPRAITVAADDQTIVFGTQPGPLTWQIVDGQLVFGDSLTGELTREDGFLPGIYAILQGSLSASGNYVLTFTPGELTILPGTPSVVPSNPEAPPPPIDVSDPIGDATLPPPELPSTGSGFETASDQNTDQIVQELNDATAYCSVIGQSEYVVDCLSERLAVIAASLPQTGDYAAARAAIDQAAQELSALVAANEDTEFPANLTRSLRPDAPESNRPLRPVRTDSLDATLEAAAGIVGNTQTLLLRASSSTSDAIHYQRIATAVGSTTTLLRSI